MHLRMWTGFICLQCWTLIHSLVLRCYKRHEISWQVDCQLIKKDSAPRSMLVTSFLAQVLYSLYTNDAPTALGTHHSLFVDDTCTYLTEKQEHHVLCKLQHGLIAVKSRYEYWNMRIIEGKTQEISFSRRLRALRTYYNWIFPLYIM
jgi:hypothetical protein